MSQEKNNSNKLLVELKKLKWSDKVIKLTLKDFQYQYNKFYKSYNEEIVSYTEQPKQSSIQKNILTLATLAVVGGAGFFMYNSQIKFDKPSEQFEQKIVIDYTQIIDSWNKQVQKNTSKREFLLSRESNDKMVEQLENWMKNFYIPEITDSSEYNQFLEKNKFGQATYFDTTMSRDEIRELLKKATKEKVMSKIVKKVLMMNDMELWKKLGK